MFDRSTLLTELETLPTSHRVAFAASCTERLLPDYLAFTIVEQWGDWHIIRKGLDLAWKYLLDSSLSPDLIHDLIDKCAKQAPHSYLFPSHFARLALHAVEAVCSTLYCCLDGEASHAALVGEQATDALDTYLSWTCSPYLNSAEEVESLKGLNTDTTTIEFATEHSKQLISEIELRQNRLIHWMWQSPLMLAELERQHQEIEFLRHNPQLDPNTVNKLRNEANRGGIRLQARGLLPTHQALT
jgi:hypothetical protein